MEKRKGFTLIELLAVIVILAVIAMITTPIVIGIIEDSKERANRRSVDGLVRAGEIYLAQSLQDPTKASNIEKEQDLINEIEYEGKRPEVGQIFVRPDGKVALAVKYGEKCYKKEYEGMIETLPYNTRNCKLNINIEKPLVSIDIPMGVFNEHGWAKENFYVTVKGTDYSDLGVTLKWCGTENESCEPSTEIRESTGELQISQETMGMRICAKAIDGFLNESEVVCSNIYKLDKTAPTFTGLEEIAVSEQNPGNFLTGVSASDDFSGVSGDITYSPTTIDMSHAYMTSVTYQVSDLAGNIGSASRNVRVGTEGPSVTFTPTAGAINASGWAKSNFYVTVGAIDHSGTGIKEIHWCGTSANTCEPSSSVSQNLNAYIQSEGNNNRICAFAVDNFDQQGEVACSDAYKLDKTVPEFTGIGDINIGKNSVIDLTSGVSVSDSLSGIEGNYSYHPTTVDTSKAGETVITYRVQDLAGNVKEITRKVVIATEKPTVGYRLANASSINNNGWAKSNFYVTINTTDYSGHGIDRLVWCGTTGNTCTPTSEVKAGSHNVMISTESSNNRICSYAVDKYGQSGSTTCSDAYKLDKTAPTAGTLTVSGTVGTNGWYTSSVTMSVNSGRDGLSGHASTTANLLSIGYETAGTAVTVTTVDVAGNISERGYTIKIDKTPPVITGLSDITLKAGETIPYQNNVGVSDNLSGISGTYSYSPNNINTTQAGTYCVTYSVRDAAGNTAGGVRKIVIEDPTLKQAILDQGTSGGIWDMGEDGLRYRGTDPDNYISMDGLLYRIIVLDTQGIKVTSDTRLNAARYVRKNCYFSDPDYYYRWGCNVYPAITGVYRSGEYSGIVPDTSNLFREFNDYAGDPFLVPLQKRAVTALWDVGPVCQKDEIGLANLRSQEKNFRESFKIGPPTLSDFVLACDSIYCERDPISDQQSEFGNCGRWNWLIDDADYTLLTGYCRGNGGFGNDTAYMWSAGSSSVAVKTIAASSVNGVRPAAYLPLSTKVLSGSGTRTDPWIIE